VPIKSSGSAKSMEKQCIRLASQESLEVQRKAAPAHKSGHSKNRLSEAWTRMQSGTTSTARERFLRVSQFADQLAASSYLTFHFLIIRKIVTSLQPVFGHPI